MTPQSPLRPTFATRNLGAVPWSRDGYHRLSVRAGAEVPSFEDPMIKVALARAALACERIEDLERALNRELWPLGYLARLEPSKTNRSIMLVEIAGGR